MTRHLLRGAPRFAVRLALLGALSISASVAAGELEIHYINVGWGSSVFVRGPNGTTILLEAGSNGKGTSQVVPYLQSVGVLPVQGLDYVIAGHQHCDHVGGLDEVVAAGYDVDVANFYNGSSFTSPTCVTPWHEAAGTTTAGAPVQMTVGTVISLGEGTTATCVASNGTVIGGEHVTVSDENDRSIAILFQHGGFDYLWASDLGGGDADEACTGRSTSQTDVESKIIAAISPGGAFPLIQAGGIDVLNVNHHGSESSTNAAWMNGASPALAVIATGDGQSSTLQLPRKVVVENVLLATVPCITVPAALVLQTEEGEPIGADTSTAGYSVGDIVITTDGMTTFLVSATGGVTQGPNEVTAAGLPLTLGIDHPATPANLVATASGTSAVTISWSPLSNADHYEVLRSDHHGPYVSAGTSYVPSFVDNGRASDTTYLYKVRGVSSTGGTSNLSTLDLATTIAVTDDPLVAGTTVVHASHVLELRTAVNAVRAAAGLDAFTFTDATLAGASIKAQHILELRTALDQARAALGVPAATYAHVLTAGTSPVTAIDVEELRAGVK